MRIRVTNRWYANHSEWGSWESILDLPHTTLQHTATHCNTLQHTATQCYTRQHTATHCNTLQHTATHCNSTLDLPHTSRANHVKWHSTHDKSEGFKKTALFQKRPQNVCKRALHNPVTRIRVTNFTLYVWLHLYMYHMHTYVCIYIFRCMHAYAYTYAYTYIFTYARTHTHTHWGNTWGGVLIG